MLELGFRAVDVRLYLRQLEAQLVALVLPVVLQQLELETALFEGKAQLLLAGEQQRLVGLEGLQQAGLVRYERFGTRNVYEADEAGLAAMRTYLELLWTEALASLKDVAESTWNESKE